ncbi:uncharacterized protein (DUF2384 family) [Bradyrhizobium sp. LM3.6]
MTVAAEKPAPKEPGNDLQKVADLLGGPRILSRRITSALDAHELLLDGQPGFALTHFVRHLLFIQTDSLEKAFGMSTVEMSWSRLSEQNLRLDKWSFCRG